MEKQDINIRRRIELIQEFSMPDISDNIRVSNDGQYAIATGIYNPVVKCFDLNQLSQKFQRGMDRHFVTFEILSDDYSKLVFLHDDRYVEFHTQGGRYYKFRIPKFGRDMTYHYSSCDLYFVGSTHQMFRFNLEQGRFLNPIDTDATASNSIKINPEHNLICIGTNAGKVEAYDPRSRTRAAVLDCCLDAIKPDTQQVTSVPEVTSLAFRDGLNMGVGTSTGQVLLYDLRAHKPMRTKDHNYNLPIRKIEYHKEYNNDLVFSLDHQVLKIWERETGKPYTSIECQGCGGRSQARFTDMAKCKQSGLFFLTNEQPKMQIMYIPSIGPAPRWASFLDSITEELEESTSAATYDDYKFVTMEELQELGLDHLMGSQLLRGHMHGFYMDMRLYSKALSAKAPNWKDSIKKNYIRSEIEKMREKRVQVKSNLPTVNKDLFLRLKVTEDEMKEKKKVKKASRAAQVLLNDDRFASLFTDKQFEVDKTTEEYKMLTPVLAKLDKSKGDAIQKKLQNEYDPENDIQEKHSEDEDMGSDHSSDGSSDDEQQLNKDVKRAHKDIQKEKVDEHEIRRQKKFDDKIALMYKKAKNAKHNFTELEVGDDLESMRKAKKKNKRSLEDRLGTDEVAYAEVTTTDTGHTHTFTIDKPRRVMQKQEENEQHLQERKEVRRSAKHLYKKLPPKFWMNKRVR